MSGSGQNNQSTPSKMTKTSPNSGKGPLKATIPISSVLKQNSNLKSSNSTTVSPTFYWKNRTSPDHGSGQRSPGSSTYKVKYKRSTSADHSVIRRTASLDTIYLKGHWPRDTFNYWHAGNLQIHKATQTDNLDYSDSTKIHGVSENDENREKLAIVRPKIRSTKDSNNRHGSPGENTLNSSSQTLSSCILSPTFKAAPLNIPFKPLPRSSMRSSVEGLNQEIEKIVLKTDSDSYSSRSIDFSQVTPEGHRAPVAEMFKCTRSRSVNTQTPQNFDSRPHSSEESSGSSPDQDTNKLGSSPHINKFLAREPPDGCEKVKSKSADGKKDIITKHVPHPSTTFKLRPSLGSAFQSLQPSNNLDQDLPLVPPRTEHN